MISQCRSTRCAPPSVRLIIWFGDPNRINMAAPAQQGTRRNDVPRHFSAELGELLVDRGGVEALCKSFLPHRTAEVEALCCWPSPGLGHARVLSAPVASDL